MRKHVIFVVDASRSMGKCDVFEMGERKSRVDAVLDACFEFIEDQLASKYSSPRDRYSMVSFNDVAKVQLRGKLMPGRDLYALRKDLEAKIRPTHGTSYGEGLRAAWDVASCGGDDAGEQVVLIFLSDGRPRDMNANCRRQQQPEYWLRVISEHFRRRLTFHGVGVGPEDFGLLEDLCSVVEGTFHHARLASTARSGKNAAKAPPVKGRPETLSNTFSNISSSVSSMCAGSSTSRASKSLALEDVEEAEWNRTNQDTYFCDKLEMVGSRLLVQLRDLTVRIRRRPFAMGGMRHCFRLWDLGAHGRSKRVKNLVGKESKFHVSGSEQLRAFRFDLHSHALARQQAEKFNGLLLSFARSHVANNVTYSALTETDVGLQVAECDVYRLEDPSQSDGFRYLLVEPFLDGKYIKYNGNNGYLGDQTNLDASQRCWWQVAQAFSHFTHHQSGGEFLVCDMQGVDQHITDPAIHSKRRQYGDGDRGVKGMQDFLEGHRCNAICRHLGLRQPAGKEESSTPASVAPYVPVHGNRCAPRPRAFALMATVLHTPYVIQEEDEEDEDTNSDSDAYYEYAF